jgi:hypothetical protein
MSFFGTISLPALDKTSTPIIQRALHRARIACNFASRQAARRIVGFLSGLLRIRTLDQRDYTCFTIANTMQRTSNFVLSCRAPRSLRLVTE